MRGKLKKAISHIGFYGITPADAGKTDLKDRYPKQPGDHPRGCGENPMLWGLSAYCPGSPPRMRGKLLPLVFFGSTFRITPADAGKTLVGRSQGIQSEDHPRGCGENAYPSSYTPVRHGSPPRMRGKLCYHALHQRDIGITPADAGKTLHGGVW